MNINELIDLLKCINKEDACCSKQSDILPPWQRDELDKVDNLPTHTENSIDLENLKKGVKRLGLVKKYGDWNDIKYFLLFHKSKTAYAVYGLGEKKEIIARLDDYDGDIKTKGDNPTQITDPIIIKNK